MHQSERNRHVLSAEDVDDETAEWIDAAVHGEIPQLSEQHCSPREIAHPSRD